MGVHIGRTIAPEQYVIGGGQACAFLGHVVHAGSENDCKTPHYRWHQPLSTVPVHVLQHVFICLPPCLNMLQQVALLCAAQGHGQGEQLGQRASQERRTHLPRLDEKERACRAGGARGERERLISLLINANPTSTATRINACPPATLYGGRDGRSGGRGCTSFHKGHLTAEGGFFLRIVVRP